MEHRMTEGISVEPSSLEWAGAGEAEAELVTRCRAGDEQACATLVEAHQRMVYHLALHLLGDHNEALDLSQEVFLRVFRTLPAFRGHASLRTWIYRIVVNQAHNRQRWWRRRKQREQVSLDDHVRSFGDVRDPEEGVDPEETVGRKEVAARVWQALDRLPFDQRTAIVLREIDGLSYEEIAYSLGVAVGTVKSRLARARQQLRQELVRQDVRRAETAGARRGSDVSQASAAPPGERTGVVAGPVVARPRRALPDWAVARRN